MAESTTIRWDKGDDGIVVLTLDDPSQSANTMNAAYDESMARPSTGSRPRRTRSRALIITSAKKTFFAGGDLNDLKQVTKENANEFGDAVREGKARCAASRRSASRSSPPSTARRSAAASRSRSPVTTA